MSEAVLRLQGIEKVYKRGEAGEVAVLQGADLVLQKGEVVALVAPSGSGKSTLLHIAGLLDTPDAGTVEIAGEDVTGAGDRQRTLVRRRDLGFVYQFHHLLPEFTALENIVLPQLAEGVREKDAKLHAEKLLDHMGLAGRMEHRPGALSGGAQQRVAIARALANGPKVLLADEPTGNLDPATSDRVFVALMDLVRETGLAALIATHNPDLAAKMDRTITLDGGKLR
ncbi:MAG: ABC transporter ATP-binding protein [Pseudomonadota bacterium]|nr:ABC transporter ATP-binding protein [Pseudomonadota bacterium]